MTILDTDQYSRIAIRAKPGVYIDFPIVDNKGLFNHFYRSGEEAGYFLKIFYFDDGNQYGIYKNDNGISYLVSAFSSKEELSEELVAVIVMSFPYLLGVLDIEVKYDLHINIENLPVYYSKLYARVNNQFILIAVINDIEKLTKSERKNISQYHGAAEYLDKVNNHIAKKTAEAFK